MSEPTRASGSSDTGTEHRLSVGGCELVWNEWRGGDEVVVLLHGSGVDGSTWNSLAAKLAPRRTVASLDRRGYGRSTHGAIGDHRIHRNDAFAVIDEVISRLAPRAIHLVGWSSGGVVALDMVAQRPEQFASVTVLEAPAHGMRAMTPAMVAMMSRVNLHKLRGRRDDAAAAFYRWAGGTKDGGNRFDDGSPDTRADLLVYREVLLRELQPTPVGSLGEHVDYRAVAASGVPVTWLIGARSRSWYRGRAEHAAKKVGSIEIVEIPDATHLMHLEQEGAVLEALEQAFSRASLTRSA
jgi:pimeloyl-ACP methyl ester carboxylesterase